MERRSDIFGEGGQPPTMQSRRQAWLFVMEKVNAVSGTRRTWEEVRKKVHDLKKSTKEKLAYNRRSRQISVGGRPDIKTLTEFENDMIALFGKETFEGLDPVDLGVTSRLSDQGETSGSSTIAVKQHHSPKYQVSPSHPEAGTSTDTPTGGDGSVEDEEELDFQHDVQETCCPMTCTPR
ncbi:myb-related transcription factor, partner of profilin-like isoform X2 [Pristis pectinata]|uniref:myb-related transcription factor, partner of profilin-like isoform X2 n=1 Tax=Pristis pectinata TaxID=685728 RepID=UPI00223E7B47|nr:myb-related transcription factor, partner of profilin-like isoform X2 [Pristis pectinata]